MHLRGQVLSAGEIYHLYNYGAQKHAIFTCQEDYDRFQILLYLQNTRFRVILRNIIPNYKGRSLANIFVEEPSDRSLVDILGYSLMPDHFHLIVRQKAENGISRFMKKLCTAYSMYFNVKYGHGGSVFQGRYKISHIGDEAYLRYVFANIHLNPFDLMQADWKDAGIKNRALARSFVSNYRHSSLCDYVGAKRPECAILAREKVPDFLKEQKDIENLLKWRSTDLPRTDLGKRRG
jgi:putative transposase